MAYDNNTYCYIYYHNYYALYFLIVGIYLIRVSIKVADIIPCCDNQVLWNKIGIVWKCSAYITPGFIQSLFIIAEV